MAISGNSYFQDKMTLCVLRFKFSNYDGVVSFSDEILDSIINSRPCSDEDPSSQLKNVCAKLSVQLSDKIDNVCRALSIPKRSFIELAIINALSEIDTLVDKHGISDCFTESIRVTEVTSLGEGS